uniref:Putative serine/threonine protein phosphatase 2C-type n=1 Tax=Magnetococcus massalia (strain MO-1) TaxID=451514 RepID=A0A1S7LLP1_MAGMO|nr:Putative serine/threonine protein phosphatase 2C-type [Candidatus Magnetococcus massalia]
MANHVIQLSPHLKAVGLSDPGCKRTLNEDSFTVDQEHQLLVVSDGMGGHDAGEVASRQVVESLCDFLQDDAESTVPVHQNQSAERNNAPTNAYLTLLEEAIHSANRTIYRLNKEKDYQDGVGMGATVVGYWQPEDQLPGIIFHTGDSRLYLFRGGQLEQKTVDHSMFEAWKAAGSVGRAPAKNMLTQALGPNPAVNPALQIFTPQSDDLLLICSDGLTGMISAEVITDILAQTTSDTLQSAAEKLIELAKAAGGKDNVTLILAHFSDY